MLPRRPGASLFPYTTLFRSGIHVPRSHSRIHTFLEDSLHEVEAPRERALFHPKLWAIRYRRAHDGAYFHRVVVGSRNLDRKSTRLNSSHVSISYAVFCLK